MIHCELIVSLFVGLNIVLCVSFFFQAEDGIRYLVRSRGLGDVYKRQALINASLMLAALWLIGVENKFVLALVMFVSCFIPVSYTHLTLPTSDLV